MEAVELAINLEVQFVVKFAYKPSSQKETKCNVLQIELVKGILA